MKFLKKNGNDCVQHIILQNFTNSHAIRSWNFRIFAMRWWTRFFAQPCFFYGYMMPEINLTYLS